MEYARASARCLRACARVPRARMFRVLWNVVVLRNESAGETVAGVGDPTAVAEASAVLARELLEATDATPGTSR